MSGAYDTLKSKQRALRDGFPENLGLRIHRAISWLGRAEMEEGDLDGRFIFLWIAFNAAYAQERMERVDVSERAAFEAFFAKMIALDTEHRIYKAIWSQFAGPIRMLLDNRFVYQPFWAFQNQVLGYDDWEDRFATSKKRIQKALGERDTAPILGALFSRLYVLRNQLIHGGATWNSSINRAQVRDGVAIMAYLLPILIDLMMDHPDMSCGAAFYPVVA